MIQVRSHENVMNLDVKGAWMSVLRMITAHRQIASL